MLLLKARTRTEVFDKNVKAAISLTSLPYHFEPQSPMSLQRAFIPQSHSC